MNGKQKQIFDYVLTSAKEKVKQKSLIKPKAVKPFNLFISGSGGVGESHLIKTIYQSVTKLLQYHCGSPEKFRVENVNSEVEKTLKSRIICSIDLHYSKYNLHLFVENFPVF